MIHASIGPCRSIAGSTCSRTLASTRSSDHGASPTKCSSDWCCAATRDGAGLSNAAMSELLKCMGYAPEYATVHGFRSTFKDWAADETDYPNEMSEIAMSHAVPDKVEAAYRRSNMLRRRSAMMEDWAAY